MSTNAKDTRASVIRFFTLLGGLYFFVYFISPESVIESIGLKDAHEPISNGFIAVGIMAIGLGFFNIVASHGSRVLFKKKGWPYSVALLLGLSATLFVTVGQWIASQRVSAEIRKMQVIGDFATRIVEDSKSAASGSPASPKSFSPTGTLPPLAVRVAALSSYANEQLAVADTYSEKTRQSPDNDVARSTLITELTQSSESLRINLGEIGRYEWSSLDEEKVGILQSIARRAARVASTYSLIRRKDASHAVIQKSYEFVFNGIFTSLGSAMFALLGVYIAAAAYRAFRIRSVESALMMSAALIVMLGQISFGKMLYHDMPALRQWLLEVPNSAAFRAIRLGAGVAGLMLAIRMWLSIESSTFSSRKK